MSRPDASTASVISSQARTAAATLLRGTPSLSSSLPAAMPAVIPDIGTPPGVRALIAAEHIDHSTASYLLRLLMERRLQPKQTAALVTSIEPAVPEPCLKRLRIQAPNSATAVPEPCLKRLRIQAPNSATGVPEPCLKRLRIQAPNSATTAGFSDKAASSLYTGSPVVNAVHMKTESSASTEAVPSATGSVAVSTSATAQGSLSPSRCPPAPAAAVFVPVLPIRPRSLEEVAKACVIPATRPAIKNSLILPNPVMLPPSKTASSPASFSSVAYPCIHSTCATAAAPPASAVTATLAVLDPLLTAARKPAVNSRATATPASINAVATTPPVSGTAQPAVSMSQPPLATALATHTASPSAVQRAALLWQHIYASAALHIRAISALATGEREGGVQPQPNAPTNIVPSLFLPDPMVDPIAAVLCNMLEGCGINSFATKSPADAKPLMILRPIQQQPASGPVHPGCEHPTTTLAVTQLATAEALRKLSPPLSTAMLLAQRQLATTATVAQSSNSSTRLARLGSLAMNSTAREAISVEVSQRVRQRLAETEGPFTLKSGVYQHELRSLTIGVQAREFVAALQECPDAPLSRWDRAVLDKVTAVAKEKGWSHLIDNDAETLCRLDDLLTSVVNKILMLVVAEHQSWYLHAAARTQVAAKVGRLVDAAEFNAKRPNGNKFRNHVTAFVEARVRNFRDAVARHVKQRAKRDAVS